ncbi:hypothetical protein [Streptomyces sp. JJ36]|uniref:hypothetical protein n=1 Tax=Streptomyces sp. JJ36 TaxID=2736645 RepID=UPI001F1F51FD|nr:hypothetical protein [Streptomyces sp. JJ36]MCF6523536.1 hypothetical protein [Streptomyces sp. JJ36]
MGGLVHRTRIVAVAAGVLLTAGLTACGSEKSGGDGDGGGSDRVDSLSPIAALQKASDSTDEQKSAAVEGTTTQGTPRGEQTTTMEGAMDWSGGGMTGEMSVVQRGGIVAGSPVDGKPTPTRYLEDAYYVNMGDEFASTAGGGAHWIKYDYDKLAEKLGPAGAFMKDQLQNNNPSRSVDLLLATGEVKKVGTETVRGEQTTHYRGSFKVAELARMQSQDLSEADLQALQDQLETMGMEKETIDLWIDEDDLLVKKREKADSTSGTDFDSTVYYSDYGTAVTVEAPAESDWVDFTELS